MSNYLDIIPPEIGGIIKKFVDENNPKRRLLNELKHETRKMHIPVWKRKGWPMWTRDKGWIRRVELYYRTRFKKKRGFYDRLWRCKTPKKELYYDGNRHLHGARNRTRFGIFCDVINVKYSSLAQTTNNMAKYTTNYWIILRLPDLPYPRDSYKSYPLQQKIKNYQAIY